MKKDTRNRVLAPANSDYRNVGRGVLEAVLLSAGFVFEDVYIYRDAVSRALFFRARARHPDGRVQVQSFHATELGYVLGEPGLEGGRPLYQLDQISGLLGATPVFVVQDERAGGALLPLGLWVTCPVDAKAPGDTDWSPLSGFSDVRLWSAHDPRGRAYARAVMRILEAIGSTVRLVDISPLGLPKGADAAKWCELHPGASADDVLALPLIAPGPMHLSGRNRRSARARLHDATPTDRILRERQPRKAPAANATARRAAKIAKRARPPAQAEVKTRKTAEDVVSVRAPRGDRGNAKGAKNFLLRVLARGPAPAKRIRAKAEAAGLGWRTIQRAKTALRIGAAKTGWKAGWKWCLPPKSVSNPEDANQTSAKTSGALR